MEKVYNIKLQGRTIQITSEEDEEYLTNLVDFVNSKCDELSGSEGVHPHDIALLVALNISDELYKEKNKFNLLKSKIRNKSALLLKMLSNDSNSAIAEFES